MFFDLYIIDFHNFKTLKYFSSGLYKFMCKVSQTSISYNISIHPRYFKDLNVQDKAIRCLEKNRMTIFMLLAREEVFNEAQKV